MRYAFIRESSLPYPVTQQCGVMGVSLSGYYAWRNRGKTAKQAEDARLLECIRAVHVKSRGTYGPRRICLELRAVGERVGPHRLPVAPNLLPPAYAITAPNRVWVADITYIPTEEGWLYLAAIADLYTRELVGWAMQARMGRELAVRALQMAYWRKKPAGGLIHHSDRGSQYASFDYQGTLKDCGMRASMSRKGCCYDNAAAESFFATLKKEIEHLRRFTTREQAKAEIFEYIEVFYNRMRRHSRIGNLAPAEFERRNYAAQKVG